jgi:hypothetical protein
MADALADLGSTTRRIRRLTMAWKLAANATDPVSGVAVGGWILGILELALNHKTKWAQAKYGLWSSSADHEAGVLPVIAGSVEWYDSISLPVTVPNPAYVPAVTAANPDYVAPVLAEDGMTVVTPGDGDSEIVVTPAQGEPTIEREQQAQNPVGTAYSPVFSVAMTATPNPAAAAAYVAMGLHPAMALLLAEAVAN